MHKVTRIVINFSLDLSCDRASLSNSLMFMDGLLIDGEGVNHGAERKKSTSRVLTEA